MGAAVLCASFMSFGVKRRWFALGAALQLAMATYASHVGGHAHYGDWLKVRMYSRTVAVIGGFLILASGAGELYRQRPRSRSLQATGQVLLGIYLICQVTRGQGTAGGQWGRAGDSWGTPLCCHTVDWGHGSLWEEPWDSAHSAPDCPWWEPQGGGTSATEPTLSPSLRVVSPVPPRPRCPQGRSLDQQLSLGDGSQCHHCHHSVTPVWNSPVAVPSATAATTPLSPSARPRCHPRDTATPLLSPELSPERPRCPHRPTRCSTAPRTAWRTWSTCWGARWPCSCCSCSTGCWRWPSCRAATCGWQRRCWRCCCHPPSCWWTATWHTGTPCAASSSGTR
uniref:Transmembrane protein 101 n=1 Tax=Taeniopygia guttata TaxID=59729 RepID=A0A674H836_TAEGU